jgi:hypothetical protein
MLCSNVIDELVEVCLGEGREKAVLSAVARRRVVQARGSLDVC